MISVYKTVQFATISYTVIILNNLTKLSAAKVKTVASSLASSEIQTTYKVTCQLNQLLTAIGLMRFEIYPSSS